MVAKKKYRNCCGKKNTVNFHDLPKETQQMFHELQVKHKIGSQYHHDHMGYTPEIVSSVFQGRRFVALGGSLIQSDAPEGDWDEPADFLTSHLKTTLGNEWFDDELKKQENERHIILSWAVDGECSVMDANKPIESRKHNGSALAYLHLAYDLFVLHNQGHITDKLISRLKSKQGFNGARYELFVLATMIRAGFNIEPFDETLGVGKVTECKATHIQTGVTVQVEAKTRNVKYVLGSTEGKAKNIRLYDKLRDAIEKEVNQPYLIFVDLNFPELNVYAENEKIKKIQEEHNKLIKLHPTNLPNAIIYTNIPFHYARDYNVTNTAFGLIKINRPKLKLENENIILNAINSALKQYQYLPREFNESEKHAETVINAIKKHAQRS
ncbi:hypothetical protein DGG96_17015 [Legionella qingyii]|uniref:Uncharacterized protein n=1 Tax=Legionella qingyii TaxID=2184757 RepID=A0A317TZF7_9GAMM|nr:hypothetical protein [Legionella qingyii]PWY54113.1 hypothetical protein DGG96_18575 [Legionella qingyii]PWY54469.1 hypothetical protein DGG96_17015 [Legionella qingyii]RUR21111.1 hypothetical protein ELY20_13440 [Legionella qingyii]